MLLTKLVHKLLHPLAIFHLVFFVLVVTNFPFGKYFLGWDAISPEFNFPVNFSRAIFSGAWQENYGLGLIGGHGFAATLPHALITFFFSFIVPQFAIRSVFTFLCLYLGGLGMYVLSKKIITHITLLEAKTWAAIVPYFSLLAAFFYMLNLGTIQMFYVQLEAFIAHFAALPWLFWILICLLTKPTRKTVFLFVGINFFASLQGFIPSLFVAYMIALCILLLVFFLSNRSRSAFKKSLFAFFLTLITNAYWLLPLAYYQLTRSAIYLQSYNNILFTQHFIDINKQYGNLQNVALLKGYLFDAFELGEPLLQPWIAHHQVVFIPLIGYIFFVAITIGFFAGCFFIKNWVVKAFAAIYLFFFISIATNTPVISFITEFLQSANPTYRQAFRTAFTKFGLGLAFSYSIFFAIGLFVLFLLLQRYKKIRHAALLFFSITFFLLFIYALPAFQGNILYKNLKISIPPAYTDIMKYFSGKEDARIADFPQECSEGWSSYQWGYFGSGFYWYGIKQPILARTFDVWSDKNENYYWEITQALREENFSRIDDILNKYNVKWVLYDPNLQHCRNQRAYLLNDAFIKYLQTSPRYVLEKTFTSKGIAPIKLYRNKKYTSNTFINVRENVPNIAPSYAWNDTDVSMIDNKNYYSDVRTIPNSFYLFRTLFTKRTSDELPIKITETKDSLAFTTIVPHGMASYLLKVKSYAEMEKSIPVAIKINPIGSGRYQANATFLFPQIFLDNAPLVIMDSELPLGEFSASGSNMHVFLNGKELNKQGTTYFGIFSFQLDNHLEIVDDQKQNSLFTWSAADDPKARSIVQQSFSVLVPPYTAGKLTMFIPKVHDKSLYGITSPNVNTLTPDSCSPQLNPNNGQYEIGKDGNQEFIRLAAKNVDQCLSLYFPDIPTGYGYLAQVKTRHVSGNTLKFSMANKGKITYNDVLIENSKQFTNHSYIIPPNYGSELGYDLRLQNTSENDEATVNDFANISFWYLPYEFIKSLSLDQSLVSAKQAALPRESVTVSHPIDTFYAISLSHPAKRPATLTLSQTYDNGWHAYEGTNAWAILFGKEIKDHVLVNNWANGWILENSSTKYVIVFLPQYLQYGGFILLGLALILPLFLWKRGENREKNLTKLTDL